MARFTLRRILQMALVLFAISVVTFLIFQVIPNGDPAQRMAGRSATEENIEAVRKTWGFDQPIYVQYANTMKQIFSGEVVSYTQHANVVEEIVKRIPVTASLAIGAGIIWLFFGILFGLLSALKAGGFLDRFLTVFSLVGVSTPVFLIGALMLTFLAFKWNLFPNGDYVPLKDDPVQWAYHLILPWAALSVLFIGLYSRVLRGNVLDSMSDDYVRTAKAKGIGQRRVMTKHVLRNSMIPIVTLFGLDFAAVIGGGAILTESVFNLPGVGQYAAQSVASLDVPPVLVVVMYGAFLVVLLSAVIDVLFAVLDPRIRLEG